MLATFHTSREFFTDESVTGAIPYTRVLLALTKKDVGKRDLYGFLALSAGLVRRKESKQVGIANFNKIAHPTIKLFWAAMLFKDDPPRSEIVAFLRKALDSKEDARTLAEMTGYEFEQFRERVVRTYELARRPKVELVKRHTIDAVPEYRRGFGSDYTRKEITFGPNRLLHAVRPLAQMGELTTYDIAKRTANRLVIPQPKGFVAKYDFTSYFENPVLSTNSAGDIFCRWTIGGNGDHALALVKKGSDTVLVKRVKMYLARCHVVPNPDGSWYLVQGGPNFTVYHIDANLDLKELGTFAGRGFHSTDISDARFISKDVLHLFWGDVVSPGDNHLRMRCIDFDVKRRKWLHDREIFRLDTFVGSASDPTVLQLADDSLHYFWTVDEGARRGEATGLFYQAEANGKTVKVSGGTQHRAIAVGNRIVVCYTQEESPNKVFFRVIQHGTLGAVVEIEAAKGRKHELGSEYMAMSSESDRIWFVNTLTRNRLYELKLVDTTKP